MMKREICKLGLLLVISFLFSACQRQAQNLENRPLAVAEEGSPSAILGEATPAADLVSASPEPEVLVSPPAQAEAEPYEEKTMEELLLEAFGRKYNQPAEAIKVVVSRKSDEYAGGTVRLEDEMTGGWWLAAKTGKDWRLVAEGNGTVACASIEAYNFPAEMVPECYDQESGEMIKRE